MLLSQWQTSTEKQPRLDTNSNSPILDHCAFRHKLKLLFIIEKEVGQVGLLELRRCYFNVRTTSKTGFCVSHD